MGTCWASTSPAIPVEASVRQDAETESGGVWKHAPLGGDLFEGREFEVSYDLGEHAAAKGVYPVVAEARPRRGPQQGQLFAVDSVKKIGLDPVDEERLHREVYLLRSIRHPNIIGIHQVFRHEPGYYYVVKELVSGGELFDRLVDKVAYTESDVRKIARVILGAIKHCHERNIAHRDIRPENILLHSPCGNAKIKIVGFSNAETVPAGGLTDYCGTPGYVAPEVLRDEPHGTAVDVWACGILMHILLCGNYPFRGSDQTLVFRSVKEGRVRFREETWATVSAEAQDAMLKMLSTRPSRRVTASEALEHPWMMIPEEELVSRNLTPALAELRFFNARRKLRASINSSTADRQKVQQTYAYERRTSYERSIAVPAPVGAIRPNDMPDERIPQRGLGQWERSKCRGSLRAVAKGSK